MIVSKTLIDNSLKVLCLSGSSFTLEQIKQAYKKQASLFHPDKNPEKDTTGIMQIINSAYEILKGLEYPLEIKVENFHTATNSQHSFIEELENLFSFCADYDDITLELKGVWLWIKGNTKPIKEDLKRLGCLWHSVECCWYLKPLEDNGQRKAQSKGYKNKPMTEEYKNNTYGVVIIKPKKKLKITN